MRIAVHRQPVWTNLGDDIQRLAKAFQILSRQAIDQIDIDRAEPGTACGIYHRTGFLHGLEAVDRCLHLGVEVLHAQRCAVEPARGQCRHPCRVAETRVDFDRNIAVAAVGKMKLPAQDIHSIRQLRGVKEVRRAATKV